MMTRTNPTATNLEKESCKKIESDRSTNMTATIANKGAAMGIVFEDKSTDAVAILPVAVVPVEPVRSAKDGWDGPGVSAEGKARATADEVAAKAAGFSVAAPVFEIGRLVNATGVENFRASRSEFDAMASARDACTGLVQTVRKEARVDRAVELGNLVMTPEGRLTGRESNGKGVPMLVSEHAFQGLCTFATPGGAHYLKECPPDLRAINANHWLEKAESKPVKVRTRLNNGTREAWSVVGPNYAAHDADKIAEQVADAMPVDAKADVTYDGYRTRINVLFHTDVQPEKAVAGEIFKAGIMVKSHDGGMGSVQIAAEVWRNLCLNLIIIDHASELVTRRSHRGNVDDIRDAVRDGIQVAMGKIGYFADKWNAARAENVLETYGVDSVDDVFRGLVANKVVHVPGTRPGDMFARLVNAWETEPGYDRASVVNAVTKIAHTESWSKWTDTEDLERLGGQLLYAPTWNVKVSEKDLAALGY